MVTEPLLLGVRRDGPGSARAVGCALAAFQPDVVLVEGWRDFYRAARRGQ